MGSINYLQAIKPDTAYLKKIIEASLLSDWAINIEYQRGDPGVDCWRLWGKTFFAIRNAGDVLKALNECYGKHPRSMIRINAEKLRPKSRILYTAYDPSLLPDTDTKTGTDTEQVSRKPNQLPVQAGFGS